MPAILPSMKGTLFLILGPSGSGKGTVIKYLKEHFPEFVFPTSCTTRTPRPGEKEGDIYHYLSKDEFQEKIDAEEFLEWAVVHSDNYYGTLKKPILDALEEGKTVIREVDMQGVQSICELLPADNVVTIFITTESWDELKARIVARHEETDQELDQRHASFEKEMAFSKEADHVVENKTGDSQPCINEVVDIIKRETVQSE
jgi:guanylate kinase